MGPLIASFSPGFNPWMYLDARPLSYLLIRKVNSPGVSDREIGVYGLITGFPLASLSPSGSEDFTMTQEAMGSKEASSSFNLKTNLAMKRVSRRNLRERLCSLGGIVAVGLDPLEFEVDEVCGVEWTSLLQFYCLHSRCPSVEIGVGTETS